MCGICGFISKNNIGEELLTQMRDTMKHRGPDDAGQKIIQFNGYYIGLAHRRLSIIDLSVNGHQPMCSKNNDIIVVYNGEIYNYQEIKNKIPEYSYKSNTDTEVILASYEKQGTKFINNCNGMFAIALFDKNKGILYLIRDRMGQKPLYYYNDGETVIFASELKSLMSYPNIDLKINKDILGRYLVKQCIISPDTIFNNVYKVSPGEIVSINIVQKETLVLEKKQYWNINHLYSSYKNSYKGSYQKAKKELKEAIINSINYRMIADVPVGILLSGGYDSSIVAALAQNNSKDIIKTYSIGILNSPLDEAGFAKKIADYIGTEHHELYISKDEMLAMIREIPKYYDEPFADSSQIAVMIVSRLAKMDVTVVLTGDGGDELFAGYPIYREEKIAQKVDLIGQFLFKLKTYFPRMYNKFPFVVHMIAENSNRISKTQFNYKIKVDIARKMLGNISRVSENYDESMIPSHDWSIKRMLLDSQTYLPDDLHCKVDRASMMFSLEARSPFMDINLIELALSMPQKFKLKGKKGKRILKDLSWELLPKDILNRPKKGFEVPIDNWMRNELRKDLEDCSRKEYLKEQGIFNPSITEKIVDDYLNNELVDKKGQKINTVIWSFYIFQMWYKTYMGNKLNERNVI